jgi:hypothetical protein
MWWNTECCLESLTVKRTELSCKKAERLRLKSHMGDC